MPDQSTFSKNRHGRFRESDLFRRVFETTAQRCIDEGFVGSEGFAVDASLIEADASKQRSIPSKEWDPADIPVDASDEFLLAATTQNLRTLAKLRQRQEPAAALA